VSYVIAEPCVDQMDQSCVAVCPVDCISSEPGADRKFFIDPDQCIQCGSCASVCPNNAIYSLNDVPVQWIDYDWIDAAWHRDPSVAREVLGEVLSDAGVAGGVAVG
jgi:ferredoxin